MQTCSLKGRKDRCGGEKEGGESVFVRLAEAARWENAEGELPDFILPLLLKVAEHPENFVGRDALVEELLQQVNEYETYSETCCEKIGFGLADLHRTLDKLRVSY